MLKVATIYLGVKTFSSIALDLGKLANGRSALRYQQLWSRPNICTVAVVRR